MKRKLICLICAVIILVTAVVWAQGAAVNEPPSPPEAPSPTVLISNTEDYALSLLGYGIGYAALAEAEDGDTLLGTYIQVGFVDAETMTSVTAEQVIAAEESARTAFVPIVYTTTLSSDPDGHIRWSVNIEALDRSVKIKSLDAAFTYTNLSGVQQSEEFTGKAFFAGRVFNADALSHGSHSGDISVDWSYELELGGSGAHSEPTSGSGRVTMP